MLTGILIIAIIGLLAALSHRRSRLENKIYKHVPLPEWLAISIFPVMLYLGWFFIVKNILARPRISLLPFEDFDILAITLLFTIYGFVGNALHFTSKILWRYLKENRHSMAFKVNEMFHGRLSHYLVYLNMLFIGFFLPILEINHPAVLPVTSNYLFLILLAGTVFGVSGIKAIFYTNEWFGGYNKPLFFIIALLLAVLLGLIKSFDLRFSLYPVSLFIVSIFSSAVVTFLMRQFFIFAHLNDRRRLRFLAKILSA